MLAWNFHIWNLMSSSLQKADSVRIFSIEGRQYLLDVDIDIEIQQQDY